MFVSTGVTAIVTIAQDHSGRVAWSSVVFKSTDGKPHVLDLLWDNNQRFQHGSGNATNLEYEFPGQSAYRRTPWATSSRSRKGPARSSSGRRAHPTATRRPARVRSSTTAPRSRRTSGWSTPTARPSPCDQTGKIPAHGSTRFRFAYVQGYKAADVAALAKQATTVFKGCTVPNVVGKTLRAAKKALLHAHCAVGKISHAHSTKVAAGNVVSENPKAGSNIDYGAKVALVVSKG